MRFITTVPTASIPSSLERFDSKYMTRVMHSRGDSEAKGERMAQPDSETANSGSASDSFAGDTACSSTRYDNGARRWAPVECGVFR